MIRDWGVHPLVAMLALAGLTFLAWKGCKTDARISYALTGLAVYLPFYVYKLERQVFLEINMDASFLFIIQVAERLLIAAFPILVLVLSDEFELAFGALTLVLLSIFIPHKSTISRSLPSPFSRWPFEFTRGFRRTWLLFLVAILLLSVAIKVGNPNLGLFALAIPFLISLSYYMEPEDSYYVWIHAQQPRVFLLKKMKIASAYVLMICTPLSIAYGIGFPDHLTSLLLLSISGLIWVITSLLAKYAHFPSELNLLQGIAVLFTIVFPPLALVVIPVLFLKAKKNLQTYLP
jgi:hypothetical protein